jgi:uncharacterized protein YndB with AHSA1/START domain
MDSQAPAAAPVPKKSGLGKKILIGLLLLIIVFVIVVAIQPADFRIARSKKINAPPAAVFPHVNDFHKWNEWSPWAKLDPAMKTTYEGAPEGEGAIYRWKGNGDVGEGVMTITESRPNELIKLNLEFVQPFAASNLAEFKFQPDGNQTEVTWSMTGKKNFMMKAVHLFMNMDKLVGGDFEKGLSQLDAAVTAGPAAENPRAAEPAGKSDKGK